MQPITWLVHAMLAAIILYFPVVALFAKYTPVRRHLGFLLYLSPEDSLPLLVGLGIIYAANMRLQQRAKTPERSTQETAGPNRISKTAVIRIGLHLLVFLIAAVFLCVTVAGTENILGHASKSRPYSEALIKLHDLDRINDSDSERVICMGDSNNFFPFDLRSYGANMDLHLPQLLQDEMESASGRGGTQFFEWAFVGATMYDYYCLYFQAARYSPDLIIVPINWRMFGSSFIGDGKPYNPQLSAFVPVRTALPQGYADPVRSKGISAMKQARYKLSIVLPLYPIGIKNWMTDSLNSFFISDTQNPPLEESEQNEMNIVNDRLDSNGKEEADILNGSIPEIEKKRDAPPQREIPPGQGASNPVFPMEILETNITFRDLCALTEIVSQNRTKVLFFIWPLDQEQLAEKGVWNQASFELSKQRIKNATLKENCYFVDLSVFLERKYFYDKNGHCGPAGRKKIAERLALKILKLLDDNPAAM